MAKKEQQLLEKHFGISSWAVDNGTTILVLAIMIFLAGVYSFITMPREAFPEISQPQVFISTPYPGSSATDVEKLVTDPLERELNRLQDLKKITSNSTQGFSMIIVEFSFDVEPDEALRRVKDKVDQATSRAEWPRDLPAPPTLIEFSFSELVPMLNINLSGDYTVDQLYDIAYDLKEDIELIPSISKCEIRGAAKREVEISVDLLKMQSLQISFNDIASAIQQENIDASAGEMLEGQERRSVRVVGQFAGIDEIRNVIVKRDNQELVYLKDIAEVNFRQPEQTSYSLMGEKPVVRLDVMKRTGENIINTTAEVREALEGAKAEYIPGDLTVLVTNDMSVEIDNMVSDLVNSIIMGMILVIVILMFFLGFKNAMFVGIAIPMSMLLSFAILQMAGITLSSIVLFSLVMALGMLVDNGIVVLENIYRLVSEKHMPLIAATKQGVGEVAGPIIASTATTLAGFVPLMFWEGIMGEFMKWLPITLIVVLSSSLFVALVVTPVLTSKYMRTKDTKEKIVSSKNLRRQAVIFLSVGVASGITGFAAGLVFFRVLSMGLILWVIISWLYKLVLEPGTYAMQKKYLPAFEEKYRRFLDFILRDKNPKRIFLGMIGLFVFSVLIFGASSPKVVFFPDSDPVQISIYVTEPIGTDILVTNERLKEIRSAVGELLDRYIVTEKTDDGRDTTYNFLVKSMVSQTGVGAGNPDDGFGLSNSPHKANITVDMVESKYRRGVNTTHLMEEIREKLAGFPGEEIIVKPAENGPPSGLPISIEIKGDDYVRILEQGREIINYINGQQIPGIEKLTLDVEDGMPETLIEIDREKARSINLSTAQVGDALRTALYGKTVSIYKYNNENYDINIRLQDKYRYDPDAMMGQFITFRDAASGQIAQVPISSVASADKTSTYSSVKRIDRERVLTIKSNVLEGYNANSIVQQIKNSLAGYPLPDDMAIYYTGEQEDMAENMSFLMVSLAAAMLLIFFIMVTQFNSTTQPFIIMSTVVFSLIGVLLGLTIFRMDFVVTMTMIGVISLAGIVVNNGIVLVDCANFLIKNLQANTGLPDGMLPSVDDIKNEIIEAGRTRLRPVILTAVTTVLGLLPLAVGLNVDFISLFTDFNPNIYLGGDNAAMWGPICWTIVFGLTLATFLTLIMVPVMLYMLYKLKFRNQQKRLAVQ